MTTSYEEELIYQHTYYVALTMVHCHPFPLSVSLQSVIMMNAAHHVTVGLAMPLRAPLCQRWVCCGLPVPNVVLVLLPSDAEVRFSPVLREFLRTVNWTYGSVQPTV
jgi:hypothetical protein